jgi:hypothetical protein
MLVASTEQAEDLSRFGKRYGCFKHENRPPRFAATLGHVESLRLDNYN